MSEVYQQDKIIAKISRHLMKTQLFSVLGTK